MTTPTARIALALAAAMILLSSTAQASDLEGIYSCRLDGTAANLRLTPPCSQVSQASAAGEVDLKVSGSRVEIFHVSFTANPECLNGPLIFSLDQAAPASGPLRPLISSFEVPVGLLITRGPTHAPTSSPAWLFASFVAGGIEGTLSGQLPAFQSGASFALDLACTAKPAAAVVSEAFTRINQAQGRFCSSVKQANLELARLDTSSEQITLPGACDPPPDAPTCTEASCRCLCIGLSDCFDLILGSSCESTIDIDCNDEGPVVSCTCAKKGCFLVPGGPDL
jgi:hypothetical protein